MRLAHSNLPPFCSLIICCASIHDVECKSWGLLEPQLFPQNDCSTNQTTVQTCAALCQSREEIVLGKTSKSCRVQERKAFCKCVARGNTKAGKQGGEKNNLMHQHFDENLCNRCHVEWHHGVQGLRFISQSQNNLSSISKR